MGHSPSSNPPLGLDMMSQNRKLDPRVEGLHQRAITCKARLQTFGTNRSIGSLSFLDLTTALQVFFNVQQEPPLLKTLVLGSKPGNF